MGNASESRRSQCRNRRRLVGLLALSPFSAATRPAHGGQALRFGTTPVFLDDQVALLAEWQAELERTLDRPVTFLQRRSYREIVDLLLGDSLDVAWLCGYPLVLYEQRLTPIAVPRYRGQPTYQSYLIVPAADRATDHVLALKNRVFAFSDPLSNSGYLVPSVELATAGHTPSRFFRRTFFTFAHRRVVEAVRVGLAHAGAVDGYVWETLVRQHPAETAGLRVAWRSIPFGFPPIVARRSLPPPEGQAVAAALAGMGRSEVGRRLLDRLNIDAFGPGDPALYGGIRELARIQQRQPS
jgi:phosphonate transport system substrate-binding protein